MCTGQSFVENTGLMKAINFLVPFLIQFKVSQKKRRRKKTQKERSAVKGVVS